MCNNLTMDVYRSETDSQKAPAAEVADVEVNGKCIKQ